MRETSTTYIQPSNHILKLIDYMIREKYKMDAFVVRLSISAWQQWSCVMTTILKNKKIPRDGLDQSKHSLAIGHGIIAQCCKWCKTDCVTSGWAGPFCWSQNFKHVKGILQVLLGFEILQYLSGANRIDKLCMPVCASTGPVLVRCWQHRPSTGPVLACHGMFTGNQSLVY